MSERVEEQFQQRLRVARCYDIQCLEHWQGGTRVSDCAVVFLRLTGRWVRFFFEAGGFFWSDILEPDRDHEDGEHAYRLRRPLRANLVERARVQGVQFNGDEGAARRDLCIDFDSGASLQLVHAGSVTTLLICAPCA